MASEAPVPERKVLLVVLDGWGLGRDEPAENAFHGAEAPTLKGLLANGPVSRLDASGEAVGLPAGFIGNSEVGHLTIGAGRVVWQALANISNAIRSGEFFENPVLRDALEEAKQRGASVHFLGLLSDGGVHSHEDHLDALIQSAERAGLPGDAVFVHAFLDGRDTPPRSAGRHLARLEARLEATRRGRVASITGRYYAMDRDKRWDRMERAYRMLVGDSDSPASDRDPVAALEAHYGKDVSDEFVPPTALLPGGRGRIRQGDVVVHFNFRPDRARQLTRALFAEDFTDFPRGPPVGCRVVTLTQYDESFPVAVAFPPQYVTDTLGEAITKAGLSQLRVAETEKYAHVTYFFNGGDEAAFPGEERTLVPSQKVATYDTVPAMSAPAVTEKVVAGIGAGFPFIVANYANMDMVGHTGAYDAAVRACEATDAAVARVLAAASAAGYATIITADHGNVEKMRDDATGETHTAHTTNPVPLVVAGVPGARLRAEGSLADVAPTVLDLMGLERPRPMTGTSLLLH